MLMGQRYEGASVGSGRRKNEGNLIQPQAKLLNISKQPIRGE
jgi:hypothetical protein